MENIFEELMSEISKTDEKHQATNLNGHGSPKIVKRQKKIILRRHLIEISKKLIFKTLKVENRDTAYRG